MPRDISGNFRVEQNIKEIFRNLRTLKEQVIKNSIDSFDIEFFNDNTALRTRNSVTTVFSYEVQCRPEYILINQNLRPNDPLNHDYITRIWEFDNSFMIGIDPADIILSSKFELRTDTTLFTRDIRWDLFAID